MIAPWPVASEPDAEAERAFGTIMALVRSIRTARADSGVEPARWISAHVYAGDLAPAFESARAEFGLLARVANDQLLISADEPRHEPRSLTVLADGAVAVLPLAEMLDIAVERARLERELAEAEQEHQRAEKQLGNEAFLARAPEHVVQVQRDRLTRAAEQIAIIRERLAALDE